MVNQTFLQRQVKPSVSVFPIIVILVLLVSGCKTMPGSFQRDLSSYVADRGDLVLFLNVKKDRGLSEYILYSKGEGKDFKEFLNRTDRVCVALKKDGEVSAAAEGDYPYIFSNCVISKGDDWNRHKDGYVWWSSEKGEGSFSVPIKNLAFYSSGDLMDELSRLKDCSSRMQGFNISLIASDSPVSIYSANPSVNIFALFGLGSVNSKINEINLFLVNEESLSYGPLMYRMSGYILFPDKKSAENFNSGFKLGFLRFARKIGKDAVSDLIRGKRFYVDGNRIVFNSLLVSIPDLFEEN